MHKRMHFARQKALISRSATELPEPSVRLFACVQYFVSAVREYRLMVWYLAALVELTEEARTTKSTF